VSDTFTGRQRVVDDREVATFERDGVSLWYRVVGSGPAVILHTGGGGDSDMFESAGYVDALTQAGYSLVCFDHRGHGRSGKPLRCEDHRTTEYVADVVALLDALDLRSAAVVGYSQGMQIAITLAATHPGRVAAVVGIGSVGSADDSTEWVSAAAASARAHGMRTAMDEIAAYESEPPPAWLIDNLSTTDGEIFALLLEASLDDERSLWEHFPDVEAPTLLVVGEREEDEDGSEPGLAGRNAQDAARTLPHGEAFVVSGLAHLGVFWRADLTIEAIVRFLREQYPPG
jgi:pimeloyl-ACP methyl ester carboxylesterase